jgi:hypothetical protein
MKQVASKTTPCKNAGIYRKRRGFGSQSVSSIWLFQIARVNQKETGED